MAVNADLENKGGDPNKMDTSEDGPLVNAEDKFDQDGNKIEEGRISEPVDDGTLTDDGKGGGDEPPPKPSDKKYKYKTIDEYDSAYTQAERKMHEATTEASALRKKIAEYDKPKDQKVLTLDDQVAEIATNAVREIRALPAKFDAQGKETQESMDARETQASVIWAKSNRKIARLEVEETNKAENSKKDVSTKLYKKATADGLSTDDELDLVGMEYGRTDPSMSTEDRVNAAVQTVKDRVSRLRDGFVKKQQQTKKEQEDLKVLGGGSRNRSTGGDGKDKQATKPSTMTDAQAEINAKRRVKKDDLLSK